MQILLLTDKRNYVQVVQNIVDELEYEIQVRHVVEQQLLNCLISEHLNLLILDDNLNKPFSKQIMDLLIEKQVGLLVILSKKENIKHYLRLNVLDYFIQPIKWDEVEISLRNACSRMYALMSKREQQNSERLIVKYATEVFAIPYQDILFMEKKDKLVLIHTRNRLFECHDSLKNLLVRLPKEFIRVHSSYIVNFDAAISIENVGNRTYHISFNEYDDFAVMSRKRSEELMDDTINQYRLGIVSSDRKGK